MKLNENLAELIGAIIGDGNIYNKRPSFVELSGHPELDKVYLTEYLTSIIFLELAYIPRPFLHARALRIRINNKKFANWLVSLGIPAGYLKCANVKIPDEIMTSDKLLKSCIRGIFDTDGFIYWDKRKIYLEPYPRLGITTKSTNLFNQLLDSLARFGFEGIYTRQDKRNLAHNLELYGPHQLDKWKTLIGTSNPKHKDKLSPR